MDFQEESMVETLFFEFTAKIGEIFYTKLAELEAAHSVLDQESPEARKAVGRVSAAHHQAAKLLEIS